MPSSPSSPSSGQYAVFDIRQDPNVSTPIRPYRNANACVSCKYKKKRCEPLAGTSGPPGICQRCHDQGLQCDYHERSSNSDSSPSPTNPRTPLTSGTTNTSPTIGYMSPRYGSRPAFAASSLPLGYAGGSPSFAYNAALQGVQQGYSRQPGLRGSFEGANTTHMQSAVSSPGSSSYYEVDCACTLEYTCEMHNLPVRRMQAPTSPPSNSRPQQ
ncbi:hypothetical protein FIBSPDRAFT_943825 [Athelia psychrophila]|uniref:Zn(2)-C6 fungal-type domain-containing protein n=1 Tax=Athelia psychrophila TaxID=1759441 RepID=A0A166VLH6_9AGAM|nr:hypothetical protein FIBSPDRAFT_943825 [Fibularhizoctonia sp. CBS 109695]